MAWPAADQVERWLDLSWFINQGPDHNYEPIDLAEFLEKNRDIDGCYIRACWPSGQPDKYFTTYYDATVDAGRKVAIYLWASHIYSVAQLRQKWTVALAGRKAPMGAIDVEESLYFKGTPSVLSKTLMAALPLADELLDCETDLYSRATYWEPHIIHGLWAMQRKFWVAAYTSFHFPDGLRVAMNHAEVDRLLPIDNGFTPYLANKVIKPEQVVGWQFSNKGDLPGYRGGMDLNYFLGTHIQERYGEMPLPGDEPDPPAEKPVVKVQFTPASVDLQVERLGVESDA